MQIKAPFTIDQVANLLQWQSGENVHPFTCPNRDDGHIGDGVLIATVNGWICPCCSYTQDWAHDFMLDGSGPADQAKILADLRIQRDAYNNGYTHEAMHTASVLLDSWNDHVVETRCVEQFSDVEMAAQKALDAMIECYQTIGRHMADEPAVANPQAVPTEGV